MKKLLLSAGILLLSAVSSYAEGLPLDRLISLRTGKSMIEYSGKIPNYNFVREVGFTGKGGSVVLQLHPSISLIYSKYDHTLTKILVDPTKKLDPIVEFFVVPAVLTGLRDGTIKGELTRETRVLDIAIVHSQYAKISGQVGNQAVDVNINAFGSDIIIKENALAYGVELELFLNEYVSASWNLSGVGSPLKETTYSINFSY